VEWTPDRLLFTLDSYAQSITSNIPTYNLTFVLQVTAFVCGPGNSPCVTAASPVQNLTIDWVALYSYTPGSTASPSHATATATTTTTTTTTIMTASSSPSSSANSPGCGPDPFSSSTSAICESGVWLATGNSTIGSSSSSTLILTAPIVIQNGSLTLLPNTTLYITPPANSSVPSIQVVSNSGCVNASGASVVLNVTFSNTAGSGTLTVALIETACLLGNFSSIMLLSSENAPACQRPLITQQYERGLELVALIQPHNSCSSSSVRWWIYFIAVLVAAAVLLLMVGAGFLLWQRRYPRWLWRESKQVD